jgi:hypothetical protein
LIYLKNGNKLSSRSKFHSKPSSYQDKSVFNKAMCSQNLENPYQVTVMSESESMNLQEESQNNHSPTLPGDGHHETDEHQKSEQPSDVELEVEEEGIHGGDDPSEHASKDSLGKKKDHREGFTAQFEDFKKAFDGQIDPESKLQLAIDFMEASLAQGGTPHFRSFWEARRFCLPLFKENISPSIRNHLWTKYSELSKEARRLKEILDEQSAFAVEQIEIAIQALEGDISQFDQQLDKAAFTESLAFPQMLANHYDIYQNLQKQLNILNAHASRINALRKELLKTEMRVRHKNKFFQRLSAAGDQVFPRRKELIKQISHQFSDDVDQFIKKHFGEETSHESLYVLREEIKTLQGLAKVLTLNTHSFTQTRTHLSKCWDQIKTEEKERKKERANQRVLFKQNSEEIEKQIAALKETLEKNEETPAEAQKKVEQIVVQMRKVELGRDELKMLRDALGEIRKTIYEKIRDEENSRQQQENERNRQKKEKYKILKEQSEQLLQNHESQEVEQLVNDRDALLQQIHDSSLTKNEKQELERLLKPLRDIITEKKEREMMALSEDDRQALQQLQNILKQRKERRQEIKNQLEVLRKTAGSSSLDFEKAMSIKTQINEEKERLEKANQAILEIERKIVEVKVKIRG